MERRARGDVRLLPSGVADWLRGQRAKGYTVTSLDRDDAQKRAAAKSKGYEGEACAEMRKIHARAYWHGFDM